MRQSLVSAAILSMFSGLVQAAPTTVDFENFSGIFFGTSVVSGGYRFTPAAGDLVVLANGGDCGPQCAANGSETLVMGGTNTGPSSTGPLTMIGTTGQNFYLLGLNYAEFTSGGTLYNATTIQLVGNLVGGGSITQTLSVDGVTDGPGGNNDFQIAGLAAGWASSLLSSLEFSGYFGATPNRAFQLDNIRVDAVPPTGLPEPGSLALAGLALLGLGGRRLGVMRRRPS